MLIQSKRGLSILLMSIQQQLQHFAYQIILITQSPPQLAMQQQTLKRIALYGGSFDPPHRGHLSIIHNLSTLTFINQIWVLPSGDRSDKALLLNMNERLSLLKKLLSFSQTDARVKLCHQEMILSKQRNRMIPTIDLLEHLEKKYEGSQFYLVVGADILSTIHTWQQHEKLLKDHHFIIIPRAGYTNLLKVKGESSHSLPQHFYEVSFNPPDISSSFIKNVLLNQKLNKQEKRVRVQNFLDQPTIQLLEEKQYF